jgi:hypothetical protein
VKVKVKNSSLYQSHIEPNLDLRHSYLGNRNSLDSKDIFFIYLERMQEPEAEAAVGTEPGLGSASCPPQPYPCAGTCIPSWPGDKNLQ